MDELPADITIEEVLREIKLSAEQQRKIDKEMDALLAKRQMVEKTIEGATFPVPEIPSIRDETVKMNIKLSETSLSAHALSSKVRALDMSQSRLQATVARVEAVLDLRTTIDTVERAISENQLEIAARNTHRILHEQQHEHNEASFGILTALEAKVRKLVVQDCQQAQSLQDRPRVLALTKLFPLVNLAYQGLAIYSQVVRQVLADSLTTKCLTLKSQPQHAVVAFPELLTGILDNVGETIQRHLKAVQEIFCPGAHLRLLQDMRAEVDDQLSELLRRFVQAKDLLRLVKVLKNNRAERKEGVEGEEQLQPANLDAVLEEIAYVSRECEMFDENVRTVGKKAENLLSQEGAAHGHRRASVLLGMQGQGHSLDSGLAHCSRVNESIQEILGHYIALEEYFMVQNVQKALQIDEHTGNDDESPGVDDGVEGMDGEGLYSMRLQRLFQTSQTSTMVDDIFFLLKKCTERACSTGSAHTACAIVNHLNFILARDYKDVLLGQLRAYSQEYLQQTEGVFSSKMFSSNNESDRKMDDDRRLMLTLNNLQTSTQHISTLKEHLHREFEISFSSLGSREMISHCLENLTETFEAFKKSVGKGMTVVITLLQPRLRPLIDTFKETDYELSEQGYSGRELEDPFVQLLIRGLEMEVKPIQGCLTEANATVFLDSLITYVVQRLESHVFKKQYTFWGGLQLDKDVRQLSACFSRLADHPVRDKLARLLQIANILQLEKASEILDYWGDGTQVWRLSEAEVRKVLLLRGDFSSKEVQNLKL